MWIPILVSVCAIGSAADSGVLEEPDPVLAAYLAEAVEQHPVLLQRHEEWLAALEVIPQVTSLDDPMFRYGQYLRSSMGRAKFEIMQKFPWFGTLKARGDAAAAEAEAALQRLYSERDAVLLEVRRWYYEYLWLAEQIAIVEAQRTVVDYVADLVEAKLSLGLATDAELLRISTLQTQLQDEADQLEQQTPAISSALASAIGRRGGEVLPPPQSNGLPSAPPDEALLMARVEDANPTVRVADARLESLRHQETLARKAGRPDITVGLEYMLNRREQGMGGGQPSIETLAAANRLGQVAAGQMTPMLTDVLMDANMINMARREAGRTERPRDGVMVSVTVSLPIYRDRVRAGVAEAKALQRAVAHEREAQVQGLMAAASQALFRMRDGARRFALYESSLLPQAEMTVESIAEKYAADAYGVSFIDLLESVQQLLRFELERARSRRDWHLGEAEIRYLIGSESIPLDTTESPVMLDDLVYIDAEAPE